MKITKTDVSHSKNMLKALGKGKWELDGMEILAFADMLKWFSHLQHTMELKVAQEEAEEKARAAEQEKLKEGKLEPKTVEGVLEPLKIKKSVGKKSKDQA